MCRFENDICYVYPGFTEYKQWLFFIIKVSNYQLLPFKSPEDSQSVVNYPPLTISSLLPMNVLHSFRCIISNYHSYPSLLVIFTYDSFCTKSTKHCIYATSSTAVPHAYMYMYVMYSPSSLMFAMWYLFAQFYDSWL